VTILQGIKNAVAPETRVYYAPGCHLYRKAVEEWGEPNDRLSEAVAATLASDVTVVCLGLDWTIEGEQGETVKDYDGSDKKTLDYPGAQQLLLETLRATGKPVILLSFSGSAMSIGWADENIPAILQVWYPGAEGGNAIAALLFGDRSPSARLPVTFYRTMAELPAFNDYSIKNRTYRYMENLALYPFGYGLGYTKFEYGKIKLSERKINAGDPITCSVRVRNTGTTAGNEIVQIYVKDREASVEVPRWQLRGVRSVPLEAGAEAEVEFTVDSRGMALFDYDGKCVLEPGIFTVYIGGSQPDPRSEELTGVKVGCADFEVTGDRIVLDP
jgi:beta-glucosidase